MGLGESFVEDFVVFFGFLTGVFTKTGSDPIVVLTQIFASTANQISPGTGTYFWLIPAAAIILEIGASYAMGGIVGLIAVGLAFAGGYMIEDGPTGAYLLIFGMGAGLLAPYTRGLSR